MLYRSVKSRLGDFASIKESIQRISDSLHKTLTEINQSANQVHSGSRQIVEVGQLCGKSFGNRRGNIGYCEAARELCG